MLSLNKKKRGKGGKKYRCSERILPQVPLHQKKNHHLRISVSRKKGGYHPWRKRSRFARKMNTKDSGRGGGVGGGGGGGGVGGGWHVLFMS